MGMLVMGRIPAHRHGVARRSMLRPDGRLMLRMPTPAERVQRDLSLLAAIDRSHRPDGPQLVADHPSRQVAPVMITRLPAGSRRLQLRFTHPARWERAQCGLS